VRVHLADGGMLGAGPEDTNSSDRQPRRHESVKCRANADMAEALRVLALLVLDQELGWCSWEFSRATGGLDSRADGSFLIDTRATASGRSHAGFPGAHEPVCCGAGPVMGAIRPELGTRLQAGDPQRVEIGS